MEDHIFSVIFAAVFILIICAIYFDRMSKKKKFESFMKIIPGELKSDLIFRTFSLTGYWNGKKVNLELIPGDKHSPSKFHIYFYRDIPISLVISSETALQNIFKKAFGYKDIEIGLPGFDREYIIQSDDEVKTKQFLNTWRCELINDFFKKDFIKIAMVKSQPELLKELSSTSADEEVRQNNSFGLFKISGGATNINTILNCFLNLSSNSFNLWKEAGSFVLLEKNNYLPSKEELMEVLIHMEKLVK
ncbi:MAG: hypothetical protein ABIH00_03500 [Armatimonadota bacterium]